MIAGVALAYSGAAWYYRPMSYRFGFTVGRRRHPVSGERYKFLLAGERPARPVCGQAAAPGGSGKAVAGAASPLEGRAVFFDHKGMRVAGLVAKHAAGSAVARVRLAVPDDSGILCVSESCVEVPADSLKVREAVWEDRKVATWESNREVELDGKALVIKDKDDGRITDYQTPSLRSRNRPFASVLAKGAKSKFLADGTSLLGSRGRPWWDQMFPGGDADLSDVVGDIDNLAHGLKVYEVTITANPSECADIKQYWQKLYSNPGRYRFYGRQCTTTVCQSLKKSGLLRVRVLKPSSLLKVLQQKAVHTCGPDKGKPANVKQISPSGGTP